MKTGQIVIYKYTCKLNGMGYVGQTNDMVKRRGQHLAGKLDIDRAIDEFGIENFLIEIIENVNAPFAVIAEDFWIEHLGTLAPHGYNKTTGNNPYRGWHQSEEAKERLRGFNLGKIIPEEVRQKISDAQKGENHYGFGIPRTQEVKDKISGSLSGENAYWFGKIGPTSGSVLTETHKQQIGDANRGEKSGLAKITENIVRAIRNDPRSFRLIGLDYGISIGNVHAIKHRRSWKHVK